MIVKICEFVGLFVMAYGIVTAISWLVSGAFGDDNIGHINMFDEKTKLIMAIPTSISSLIIAGLSLALIIMEK